VASSCWGRRSVSPLLRRVPAGLVGTTRFWSPLLGRLMYAEIVGGVQAGGKSARDDHGTDLWARPENRSRLRVVFRAIKRTRGGRLLDAERLEGAEDQRSQRSEKKGNWARRFRRRVDRRPPSALEVRGITSNRGGRNKTREAIALPSTNGVSMFVPFRAQDNRTWEGELGPSPD